MAMNEVVANLFVPTPKNSASHVRGWAEYWARQLNATVAPKDFDMYNADVLCFDHGVNATPGFLNLFGGVSDEIAARLIELVDRKSMPLISLDYTFAEMGYVENLRKRMGQNTTSVLLTPSLIDAVEERFKKPSGHLTVYDLEDGDVFIGDSHTTSFSTAKARVSRRNGLTLHGALRDGYFEDELAKFKDVKSVTLCAGSIDIRHHIMRQPDPPIAVDELVAAYVKKAKEIIWDSNASVSVKLCAPVPVEYEERRIPKTGYYKGQPFTGGQRARAEMTKRFIARLYESRLPIIQPPAEWYTMDPEQYAKDNMELMSSVHISPAKYRCNNWGRLIPPSPVSAQGELNV